jgi:plasmid stabilization system protein ParE
MASVIWSGPALEDLERILDYISLDNPEAAQDVAGQILSYVEQIESHPLLGKRIESVTGETYRQLIYRPCKIIYRVDDETIYILHVQRLETTHYW